MSKVQISKELFRALIAYHLLEIEEERTVIEKELEEKIEAMIKRELYTKYKTAPTKEEQEIARKEYLDKCGIRESFRW